MVTTLRDGTVPNEGSHPFQHRALLVVGTARVSLLADRPYGIAFHVLIMFLG